VLENYAFPGGLMLGTDSHTPNGGGLGMLAIGVGGADAVDVMAGFNWEVLEPKLIGIHLTGEMSGWASPKDIILYALGVLTVKGGTNAIVEYFGPGARSISATGKGTICNMGAELGATTSVFAFDERMESYLRATKRGELADLAQENKDLVTPDPEVEQDPGRFYDRIVELDLSKLEPHLVGPHTPDLARPVSEIQKAVEENDYPDRISVALIGSCTNSSYEDIGRATDVAEQALSRGVKMAAPLMVSPGSEQIMATIQRDGQMEKQWKRDEIKKGEKNTIITSFNRNFPGRNDANPETLAFIGSPEIVMAYGLAGRLSFNPLADSLEAEDGSRWKLEPPKPAPDIPENGFVFAREGYVPPAKDGSDAEVVIAENSERLERLSPFATPEEREFLNMPLLLKTKGKTTTDHISPAGPWLRYRGHLDNISDNMFTGAINAFTGGRGTTRNPLNGETDRPVPEAARAIRAARRRWVVVGDDNYGEGSSREHAAMSPRLLGAGAIIVRSFARIHETNLKKQGVLALAFADPGDYEKVREDDEISLSRLEELGPKSTVIGTLVHQDGTSDEVELVHTLNVEQVAWFRAGSALNLLRMESQSG
jgi:aconitate hydratase